MGLLPTVTTENAPWQKFGDRASRCGADCPCDSGYGIGELLSPGCDNRQGLLLLLITVEAIVLPSVNFVSGYPRNDLCRIF